MNMNTNCLLPVKSLSRKEALATACFFYEICTEIEEFRNIEECQTLYKALVSALSCKKHAAKVIDAFIQRHVRDKKLTPLDDNTESRHIFDFRGELHKAYKEDSTVYDKCGSWSSDSEQDVNLLRAVFAAGQDVFPKLLFCTFFCKGDARRKSFPIPTDFDLTADMCAPARRTDRVRFFADSFRLDTDEALLLNTAYLCYSVRELNGFLKALGRRDIQENRLHVYALCTGISEKEIRNLLRKDRKLRTFGIMNKEGELEEDVLDCILAGNIDAFFCDVLKEDERKNAYALDSFSVKQDVSSLAVRLLNGNGGMSLLLYGAAGTGKTEYARSIAREAGLTTYVFKNELELDGDDDKSGNHALCRLNCILSLPRKGSVIIVDEAETVLKTQGSFLGMGFSLPQKGTVNKMLENSVNKVIWILNYTRELDESTLRRFTYSIRFNRMGRSMLRNIADSKLKSVKMSGSLHTELVDLCGEYRVTGASVDNMVRAVQGMDLSSSHEERVVSDVRKVLEANSMLLSGQKSMRDTVRSSYDLSVLNTSMPAADIVGMVENAQDYAERNGTEDSGIRMLFYGPSGTGKTELARCIAEKLGRKILLKRASDILGKYVGENEANIREAFEEAEASGDVLLFDEADSFFSDRNSAVRGWERTMVNEFLTQMEEFHGILICTTNLRSIMDAAMQRRFHILTEFKPLTGEGIRTLLGRFFGGYAFDGRDIRRLSDYGSVTPGDFGALEGKLRFMPQERISPVLIIDELCKMQEEKNGTTSKAIGFSA